MAFLHNIGHGDVLVEESESALEVILSNFGP
jgi:hypothetical protein